MNNLHVIGAKNVPLGTIVAEGLRTWDSMFKGWLVEHPELPPFDGPWVFDYINGQATVTLRPSFLHKGFTITPLSRGRYQVTTPTGKVLPKVCNTQDEVRGLVFDYRYTEDKDRCEECTSPSKGPLMTRADGYHRVCHECAASKWPKHWAFFRRVGWYPRTKSELESGRIEQDSYNKNWDGTKRAPWVPKVEVAA